MELGGRSTYARAFARTIHFLRVYISMPLFYSIISFNSTVGIYSLRLTDSSPESIKAAAHKNREVTVQSIVESESETEKEKLRRFVR
jgi:hypothetical protein